MSVNFSSNSHPVVPRYDSRAPLAQLVETAKDRRVIIIHDGILTLDPAAYLADRLYQAFLMYNHKLVLCECFSEESVLDHCLRHMIHSWCSAMKVEFIVEDPFLNQSPASLGEVAQATAKWLAVYAEKNLSSPVSQCGVGKGNMNGGSVSGAGKRRYSSKSKPPAGDGRKRKGTGKTKSAVSKKKQSKSRKPAPPSKKGRVVRFNVEQMLPKAVVDTKIAGAVSPPAAVQQESRPLLSTTIDKKSPIASEQQQQHKHSTIDLTGCDATIDLSGCDDDTENAAVSPPPAIQEDATRPLLSTTTTDERSPSTAAPQQQQQQQQHHKYSESTVEGFHEEEQPPVFASLEEEERADKALRNIPFMSENAAAAAAAASEDADDDHSPGLYLNLEQMSEEEFLSMEWAE